MTATDSYQNPTWLQKLWPIQRFELKKFIPLFLLKFFASVIYTLLTIMKDSLIVTADQSGAEAIPVIKGWLVFPLSILVVIAYSKLSNVLKRSTLFYSIILFFMGIFVLYGFFLYPNADILSPTQSADAILSRIGAQYSHWIAVYRHWIHSLFFITSEFWGQLVLFILFWGFANHICQIKEAKRTYILFIAAGDVGTIVAGPIIWSCRRFFGGDTFTPTLQALITCILFVAVLVMLTYWWINRYVLVDKRYFDPTVTKQTLNQKTKLSLIKSIKHICSSKYLLSIAIMMIGCAFTINIIEVTWKANLKIQFPNIAEYADFMGMLFPILGVVALITALLGGNVLRIFGWRFCALITPISVGITGVAFFLLYIFKDQLGPFATLCGTTPLMLIIWFGFVQNILSKNVKYTFFDSTKEMAYIPLDPESKVKGKAAIDMVGSRLGKSSSSYVQLLIMQLVGTGSVLFITPYLIPIVIGVSLYWYYSVNYLDKELSKKDSTFETSKVATKTTA